MLIMIIHGRGITIPYTVIEEISSLRAPQGTHIPLPAKSNREWAEAIEEFIIKALENPARNWLLVVNEELSSHLKLEKRAEIDCMLYYYTDNNGRPAVSVWKSGIGDEGVTYEEFLQDYHAYEPLASKTAERSKALSKAQRAA